MQITVVIIGYEQREWYPVQTADVFVVEHPSSVTPDQLQQTANNAYDNDQDVMAALVNAYGVTFAQTAPVVVHGDLDWR